MNYRTKDVKNEFAGKKTGVAATAALSGAEHYAR